MPDAAKRTLPEWLTYIDQTHPQSVALGLERVRTVAERLSLKQPAAFSVLIAGTNGKGSTAIALERLLLIAGDLRVGVTLSPHLEQFNERIRVQGELVDDGAVCTAFAAIEDARGDLPLTYFEFAALAALYCFDRAACDVIVLEIGLGGRLDAFNIIDADLAVITSIGLDHQAWLGDTLDAIGAEKAGILRRGQQALFGPVMPSSVTDRARALEVDVATVGVDLAIEQDPAGEHIRLTNRRSQIRTPWIDDRGFVPANVALAWAAGCTVLTQLSRPLLAPPQLKSWARALVMPGRCERRAALGRHWLLDVGHNPLAADYLAARLQTFCGPAPVPVAVFGCFEDKPGPELMARLAPQVEQWVLVPTDGPRGQSSRALAAAAEPLAARVHQATSVEQGLRMAHALAPPGAWVLVFGGFAVVGAARAWLDGAGARCEA